MSDSDGFLKMALVAGAVLVGLGGGLYLSTMSSPPEAPAIEKRTPASKPAEDLNTGNSQKPVLSGIPARVIARMTEPRVTPSSDMEGVDRVFAAALPTLQACYDEHAGIDNEADGTAYVRFRLDADRKPGELGVLLQGAMNDELEACLRSAITGLSYASASPDTLIAWPFRYRGLDGLGLR